MPLTNDELMWEDEIAKDEMLWILVEYEMNRLYLRDITDGHPTPPRPDLYDQDEEGLNDDS